jgi:hypothetical protein
VRFTRFSKVLSLTVIGLVLAAFTGCAVCLSPLVLGPSATVGSTAGEAGISRYENGKIKSFELARYEDVVEATRRAGAALSLNLKKESGNAERSTFYYVDDKNEQVKVTIEPRTDSLTHIQIDVGFFGSKGLALVMINQIVNEISSEGKYLQEWPHQRLR